MQADAAFNKYFREEWDKAAKVLLPNKDEIGHRMLTYHNPNGTWGLYNYDIKEVPRELYGAISKLKDYEKLGYQPAELEDILEKLKEAQS